MGKWFRHFTKKKGIYTANKFTKCYSTPLVTSYIEIKTTVSCHYTHIRKAKIKLQKLRIPSADKDAKQL